MKRSEIITIGAPVATRATAATKPAPAQTRKLFTLEPSPPVMAAARERAVTARRQGRGPREILVDIAGDIDADMAARVETELSQAIGARQIVLMIDSRGGDVEAAKRIHRAVRRHPAEKRQAVITDKCHSAAVLVAVAADYRTALPGASILMHRTACAPADGGRWTAAAYARHAADLHKLDDELLDVMEARTGASRAALARQEDDEKPTPLILACSLGLIHEVPGLRSLDRTFHDTRRAAMARFSPNARQAGALSVVIGAPSYLKSDAYTAACRAAPEACR